MSIGVHRIYIPMSYARIDFSTLQFSLVRQTPFFCWITFVVVANMNENLVFECRNNDEYIAIDLEVVFPVSQFHSNLVAGHWECLR